ncbi:oxygenase MpaB family protein [Jongsikchunia kroppenstedtii]|uniref:oxygenase MpaB family protein n=1 Tax=Jongsikchunia kroppenstedtii TaxID=1121721 RepID=UPI00037F194F|nr:oxygenase MpaB family protein [Jongsikchunia kroppenstedtii]
MTTFVDNTESQPASSDLADRVSALTELARTPGSEVYLDPAEVDLEAWNHVGDPLAEDLVELMRAKKLMGGDLYANARSLEAEGVPEAVAFFKDVETLPSWFDIDSLRAGASMGRRNPFGMQIGMLSALPFTYIDPATAEVMGATGRLSNGGDYRRRMLETAVGFLGALDADGMLPGGDRWIVWVRIRLMHTMIRLGIHRSGRWTRYDLGAPLSQLATAACANIFGQYRVNVVEFAGGVVSQEERDGFALMWRWVARIEGANNQLLGRTHAEEFELQSREHQCLYEPNTMGAALTENVIDGSTRMGSFGGSRAINQAVARQLLAPRMTRTVPNGDFRDCLGVAPVPWAEMVVRIASWLLKIPNQLTRLTIVRRYFDRNGQRMMDQAVERGLKGVKAEFRGSPVAGRPTDQ